MESERTGDRNVPSPWCTWILRRRMPVLQLVGARPRLGPLAPASGPIRRLGPWLRVTSASCRRRRVQRGERPRPGRDTREATPFLEPDRPGATGTAPPSKGWLIPRGRQPRPTLSTQPNLPMPIGQPSETPLGLPIPRPPSHQVRNSAVEGSASGGGIIDPRCHGASDFTNPLVAIVVHTHRYGARASMSGAIAHPARETSHGAQEDPTFGLPTRSSPVAASPPLSAR